MSLAELVPDSPSALGLPFTDWRKYQREAVQDILRAYQEGYKVVLLSAPTGSGKTIIGAAVGRMLEGKSLFLSHTIRLQQQQLRTLPDARTATGRSNHPCIMTDLMGNPSDMTAEDAPCLPCPQGLHLGCPYYMQVREAGEAPEAVLNYAYALRVLQAYRLKGFEQNPFSHRGLMVCDEGHLLERAMVDATAAALRRRTFQSVGMQLPGGYNLDDWREWAEDNVRAVEHEADKSAQAVALAASEGKMPEDARRTSKRWKSVANALNNLLELGKAHVHLQPTPEGVLARPLWVWDLLPSRLFRHADHILIMSATLGDPAITARLLGLQEHEVAHIEVPSTFPVENRPVFYWPVARMRHGMAEEEKIRQAQALVELASKFPNSPGVVHCNSFALGAFLERMTIALTERSIADRLLLHRPGTDVVRQFEAAPSNDILISPSCTTGVDWDFVGWAMIPKVPFPDLSDDVIRLRTEYVTEEGEPIGQKVYRQGAAMTVVQASGRHVRTEKSKGVTVITDSNFWALYKHLAPGAFPEWFKEAVQWR
jgi:Rad3-related DNA helicase